MSVITVMTFLVCGPIASGEQLCLRFAIASDHHEPMLCNHIGPNFANAFSNRGFTVTESSCEYVKTSDKA